MALDVELHWTVIEDDRDPAWAWDRVLYAICHDESEQVLYLGKADFCTVRQRLACRSKGDVWNHITKRFGSDNLSLCVGDFQTGARLTTQLLADVESLLIARLRPCCNIQSTQSRIRRPGLRVTCVGDWTARRDRFVDN